MQGAAVLVGRGHVGAEARLRLNRVRQREVGRELLRLRGAQVEVAAGGSVRMLRPLKGGTWRGKDREDAMRARTAPLLHRPPPPHPLFQKTGDLTPGNHGIQPLRGNHPGEPQTVEAAPASPAGGAGWRPLASGRIAAALSCAQAAGEARAHARPPRLPPVLRASAWRQTEAQGSV